MGLTDLAIVCPNHYKDARVFNLGANCVAAHYLLELPAFETGGTWKLIVEAHDSNPAQRMRETADGVFTVARQLSFSEFWTATPSLRRRQLLDLLHGGALQAAQEKRWNPEPFEAAKAAVLSDNLVLRRFVGKPTWNRSRTRKAIARFEFTDSEIIREVVTLNAAGEEIGRYEADRLLPHLSFLEHARGRIVWADDNSPTLVTKTGVAGPGGPVRPDKPGGRG